jgi:NAD(P)-dependent dehydrogenase (short-subunit alcohol dehydrogenase family)
MTMDFKGQTVMITGGAGNLGRATAEAFAAVGARRILLDLDRDALKALYGADREDQLLLTADLTDAASVSRAVQEGLKRFGRIDVLCNIAGGFRMGPPVHQTSAELWRSMMGLNAESIVNVASAVVPAMLKAGRGKIVNVAAAAGTAGRAHMGAYSASKSAVIRLTETMAAELREQGINVNCVLPSILDTPQNRAAMPGADPVRWVAPHALAEVIVFLASDRARAVHGAALPVSGLS